MNPINTTEQPQSPGFIPDAGKARTPSWGKSPSVLADVFEESVNIAVWQRDLAEDLQDAVGSLVATRNSLTVSMTVSPDTAFEGTRESLGTDDQCAISEDVAALVKMYCYLFGIKRAGLRLAILDKAMCPKFHVDRVPCRLVTTYLGPATEWLPHDTVDRSKLGAGSGGLPDLESGLFASPNDIERLSCGDVALLKGELWDGNEDAGLVHRSPAASASDVRLLLTLDVSS